MSLTVADPKFCKLAQGIVRETMHSICNPTMSSGMTGQDSLKK